MKDYKTVLHEATSEFTEKKSRFICYVSPVKNETEAIEFVNMIKKKHPDARHNVYAYCVRENNIQRFSDDGEPQGTAGIPVLDTIRKQGLTDIALVVTRYFGGILLGGGGLVRAYSHASSLGIEKAEKIVMRYSEIYSVRIEYNLFGKVEYELRKMGLKPENTLYDLDVSCNICVLKDKSSAMIKNLTEATAGRIVINKTDERFVGYKEEKLYE